MSKTSDRRFQFSFANDGITFAVRALILTNAAIFAAQLLLDIFLGENPPINPAGGTSILGCLAYSNGRFLSGWVWVALTYMFIHAGLYHLFMNMLQLYFFGPDVERLLGTRQFIGFFLGCGVVGALVNFVPVLFGRPDVQVLGASGAILGVLVAFAINDPDRQIYFLPLPFPITARAMILVFLVYNLIQSLQPGGPISVGTHLGGMAAGFGYMKLRPLTLRWSWQRRGRRVRREKTKPTPPDAGGGGNQKKLADAIVNIFRFQDREKH